MGNLVSVIIPAHNEEGYIAKTLHSLKLQKYQNFEVIVVTNGCSDKTEEIVRKRVDAMVKHVTLPEANVCLARNAGAKVAAGSILMFLDADTQLKENTLHIVARSFGDGMSVATTKVLPDNTSLKFRSAMALKNFYNKTGVYQGCSGALICRKDDFEEVGGYDPAAVVREHRKLTLKLKTKGKYKCLDTYVVTSMRRFENWGLVKGATYWAKQWFNDHFRTLEGEEYEKVR